MFCHNCGANMPDGAKFCGNCGAALLEEIEYIPHTNNRNVDNHTGKELSSIDEVPKRKEKGCFLRFISIILAIIIVYYGVFFIAGIFGFELPRILSDHLYVYNTYTVQSETGLSEQDKLDIQNFFAGTYIEAYNDTYRLINLETGLGGEFTSESFGEFSTNEYKIGVESNGAYVYITVQSQDEARERIIFTFRKASIKERWQFYKYIY